MSAPNGMGRPRKWPYARSGNAIPHITGGCRRATLLKDAPPFATVKRCFNRLRDRMPGAITHTADTQDRDGAQDVILHTKEIFPAPVHPFAVAGYAGQKTDTAEQNAQGPAIEIARRPDGANGFDVLARRWLVERIFAELGRCRRLVEDREATAASPEAWLFIAPIRRTSGLAARPTTKSESNEEPGCERRVAHGAAGKPVKR